MGLATREFSSGDIGAPYVIEFKSDGYYQVTNFETGGWRESGKKRSRMALRRMVTIWRLSFFRS